MKKRKRKCDYIGSRNANLRREFRALLGSPGCTLTRLFSMLATVPADRFYISEERAYSLLRRRLDSRVGSAQKAASLGRMRPNKAAMLLEIEDRVRALLESEPGLTLKEAVFEVVNSPAPSFYLSASSIKTLIYA